MKRKSGKFQPRYMTRKLSATALSRQGLGGLHATRALLGKRQSRSLTADSVWSVCVYASLVLQLAEPTVTLTTVTRSDLESVRLSVSLCSVLGCWC